MLAHACRAASLPGVILLTIESSHLAIWSVVITSGAGLVAQVLKMIDDAKREERRHKFEKEDREAASASRANIDAKLAANLQAVAENTAITRDGLAKSAEALDTANHVNEKIASIAAAALGQPKA